MVELPLIGQTPSEWTEVVLGNFDKFLVDHAACERKAAALAMSFVAKHPDRKALIEPMVCLAREELEHFHQVWRLINRRGGGLAKGDEKDPYINQILSKLPHGREERFLYRLVMSGMVEARGWERFGVLSAALEDPDLAKFYRDLADREAGHYMIFIRVARHYFSDQQVDEAVEKLAQIEYDAMSQAELRPALH